MRQVTRGIESTTQGWNGECLILRELTAIGAVYLTDARVLIGAGSGSPQTVVTAPVGSLFLRADGGAGTTLYVKESGTGNTGWVAK